MRKRLLRDSELTLNKAANMVRAFPISRIQVSDLEGKTAADSIQKSKVRSASDQGQHSSQNIKRKCCYCGTTHKKQACPAYGKKCLKCKKLNHSASDCRSKYKIHESNDTNSNTESDVDINEL